MMAAFRRWRCRLTRPAGRRVLLAPVVAAAWLGWAVLPPWPLREWATGSTEPIHWLLTPDRTRLACVTWRNPHPLRTTQSVPREGSVRLWDLTTGHERFTLPSRDASILQPVALHFVPGGSLLLSPGDTFQLRDAETGDERWSTALFRRISFGGWSANSDVSPDGRFVACRSRWDASYVLLTATGLVRFGLGDTRPLAFSPDSQTLVSFNDDAVSLWDMTSGRLRRQLTLKHRTFTSPAAAFSPDGRWLAVWVFDGTYGIKLWDLRAEEWVAELDPGTNWGLTGHLRLEFSSDGSLLVAPADDGRQRAWDMTQSPPRAIDVGGRATQLRRNIWSVMMHQHGYLMVEEHAYPVFASDGTRFVGPGPEKDTLAFRETAAPDRAVIGRQAVQPVGRPEFAPDGRTLAVLHSVSFLPFWEQAVNWLSLSLGRPSPYPATARSDLVLFDTRTGAVRGRVDGLADRTHLIGFGPDGHTVWTMTHTPDPPTEGHETGDGTLRVQQWAIPSEWPPVWLIAVTALGVLFAVADWRRSRRRAIALGAGTL